MGAENPLPRTRNGPMSIAPRGADEKEIPISSADAGPLDTRDAPFVPGAVAPDEGRTFIHPTYSRAYGVHGTKLLAASSHT